MVDIIHRVGRVVDEIITVEVVDIAVAVVVGIRLAVHLLAIVPEVECHVRVGGVDARVQNGHEQILVPGDDIPGLRRIDIGVHEPTGLARIVQGPLVAEFLVVGRTIELVLVVRLGI